MLSANSYLCIVNITALHISHLLPGCRALAVGGLGVFERLVIPSSYDPEHHLITPPSVRVVFERDCMAVSSDVLLESIERSCSMDRDEAARRVRTDVGAIEEALQRDGHFVIPSACTLTLDPSTGVISCLADDSFVDSSAYGWLEPLVVHPLAAAESNAEVADKSEREAEKINRNAAFPRSVRIAASSAAAIAVFAIVAIVLAFVNRISEPQKSQAMASVSLTSGHSASGTGAQGVTPAAEAPLVLVFRTPADGVSEARVRADIPERERGEGSLEPHQEQRGSVYCLIVASLSSRAEAEAFVAGRRSGPELEILETQGRYRVYAMEGDDAASLMTLARESGIYDVYPSAWVCRR